MTQYDDRVERQRLLLEAEKWAQSVKDIHVHGLSSMWYDDRPEDTADGKYVTDTAYNSGLIERSKNGKIIHTFGEKLTGELLIREYERKNGRTVLNSE